MQEINLEATEKSPAIRFDPDKKKFEMLGNSRPENVRDFYIPVLDRLRDNFEEVLKTPEHEKEEPIKFVFKLEYFNSSSAKFISDLLVLIGNYHRKGVPVKIYWYFQEGDEDMMEVGEDFSEMIDLSFQMVMVSGKGDSGS